MENLLRIWITRRYFLPFPSPQRLVDCGDDDEAENGNFLKEELVETLMGTTPLKQISKRIDVKWEEDLVVPRYNGQRSQRQCSLFRAWKREARRSMPRQIERIPLPDGFNLANGKAKEMPVRNPCSICSRTSVCYHPDDFYLDYAVQGLSEAGYHLLHDSFGICRCV